MVDTIGPMVRSERSEAWPVRAAHVAGGTLGGGLTGFVLGALGSLTGSSTELLWLIVAAAPVALVWDAIAEGKKLGTARQTPRSWRYLLPFRLVAFLNGFDLGLGWSTRIYFLSYLVAMLAAFASGHALAGAAVGAAFGATRAITVAVIDSRRAGPRSMQGARGKVVLANEIALAQFLGTSLILLV